MTEVSALQTERYRYEPKVPAILRQDVGMIAVKKAGETGGAGNQRELQRRFPHIYGAPAALFKRGENPPAKKRYNVGVVLSGGPAPGGHNVIAGLLDSLKQGNPRSKLYGFLNGPAGLINCAYREITPKILQPYRNTGGFDIIGSGRDKVETPDQFRAAAETAAKLDLDAVVIVGGDDSNTNAAVLAEHFASSGAKTRFIGVPKTIDGDLKNEFIETSFGFDSATKVYSQLVGNIARDACSSRKYWHFIKVMGRSASHIALECALQTQANICLISEEVEARGLTLAQITEDISRAVAARAEGGENFGVVIIPEGLVEFIPEIKKLIGELNGQMAKKADEFNALRSFQDKRAWLGANLSEESMGAFNTLPEGIAAEFLIDRDPHGNVQVSRIETERLLATLVEQRVAVLKKEGKFHGNFASYTHFFGYEGRCGAPSNFDADYCYALGKTAFMLLASGLNGYLASVRNLTAPPSKWTAGGVPLTSLMHIETRKGEPKPVIKKALVDLKGPVFRALAAKREEWALKTSYLFPGSPQYFGPAGVSDRATKTLVLESLGAKKK
ncbi:MAG: diphosphate--fructose-6-phosphate 1-phosphotransferase [Spirochaetaceae bacterium]|jgi:pyrophosphate--fructose-6-phosphate 1-phosphotransferase|nr:diphosphate--fructose-6-phosphate 1-phosphotransferase [Spirochaetaceae bacterium]